MSKLETQKVQRQKTNAIPELFKRWTLILVCICSIPALFISLGVDFGFDSAFQSQNESLLLLTLLEWSAICIGVFVALMAIAQYKIQRVPTLPVIAIVLLSAAAIDIHMVFVTDGIISSSAFDTEQLASLSWAISRGMHASLLFIGLSLFLYSKGKNKHHGQSIATLSFIALVSVLGLIALFHSSQGNISLPDAVYLTEFVHRPYELYALILYSICALIVFPLYVRKYPSSVSFTLWLSTVPAIAAQCYLSIGYQHLYDSSFVIAYILKMFSFLLPMGGLIAHNVHLYLDEQKLTADLNRKTNSLTQQTLSLKEAQSRLRGMLDFVGALNQSNMNQTYQEALRTSQEMLDIPACVLFTTNTDDLLEMSSVMSIDYDGIHHALLTPQGLPNQVATTASEIEVTGPFDGGNINLGIGVGKLKIQYMIGWPIVFQGKCIGVLITLHINPLHEQQKAMLRDNLEQLAVRINNFRIEALRMRLVQDLKSQSSELQLAKEEAIRASEYKSNFIANVSHDLRTPLNSIIGFTKRLIKRCSKTLDEKDLDALQTVERNAHVLLTQISEILDASKIEAGKSHLDTDHFNLSSLAKNIVHEVTSLVGNKPLELTCNEPEMPIYFWGDELKIRKTITNILANAIKFTENGKVSLNISKGFFEEITDRECVKIDISDTGLGIHHDDLKKLFKRFSQVSKDKHYRSEGTGLGLSIAFEYAKLHAGTIKIDSLYGKGSTFSIILPCLKASGEELCYSSQAGAKSDVSRFHQLSDASSTDIKKDSTGIKILCADSDPDNLKFLKITFEDAGFTPLLADGYNSALFQATTKSPDIICLDLDLPGKNGFELIKSLKNLPMLHQTAIIALSARGAISRPEKYGIDAALAKPIDTNELILACEKALMKTFQKVLIFDNEQHDGRIIHDLLSEFSAHVDIKSSSENLIKLEETQYPDLLIFTDENDFHQFKESHSKDTWAAIPKLLHRQKTSDNDDLKTDSTAGYRRNLTERAPLLKAILSLRNQRFDQDASGVNQ